MSSLHRPELLAPAGSKEAFRGAVNAGADAVYLAGKSYGARAYADNFGEEELILTLREAGLLGVKIYLTANVLTRECELPELVRFVRRLWDEGLDGVIVQDLGTAAALRKACPGLPLHASTQMSVTGPGAAQLLREMGFTRVVPARELRLEEIRLLKKTGMEVETFIHGAMCYSYSGRCLMSSFLGGRSGNRGQCAGPCRLPYTIVEEDEEAASSPAPATLQTGSAGHKSRSCSAGRTGHDGRMKGDGRIECAGRIGRDGYIERDGHVRQARHRQAEGEDAFYPLSMKDLCVLPLLPELIDAGIDSFKIEGRMKRPEYAAGVTAVYRRYIDRFAQWDAMGRPGRWQVDEADLRLLQSLYIRTDLSTGYYHERNGRDMLTLSRPGYSRADPGVLEGIRRRFLKTRPQRSICGQAYFHAGKPAELEVYCVAGEPPVRHTCTVYGPPVQSARSSPLTEEDIRMKLLKTGDTPFTFEKLSIDTDGASFLPFQDLNDLRRRALAELEKDLTARTTGYALRAGEKKTQDNNPSINNQSIKNQSIKKPPEKNLPENVPDPAGRQLLFAMAQSISQARAAASSGADVLILDGVLRDEPEELLADGLPRRRVRVMAALPQVLRAGDDGWLTGYLRQYGPFLDGYLARNLEELAYLHRMTGRPRESEGILRGNAGCPRGSAGCPHEMAGEEQVIAADSGIYCWNRASLGVLKPFCSWNVLPLELDRRELARTFRGELSRMILPVYGRAPMMITANCVRKTAGRCTASDRAGGAAAPFARLRDRTGAVLPVQIDCRHCCNVIYNSVPTSLASCLRDESDPLLHHVGGLMISFTDETAADVVRVMRAFRGGTDLRPPSGMSYTSGHYRKGAE